MNLTKQTTIHDLLEAHPFLLDFLVAYNPKFEMLKNKLMRATMGRVATLERVATIGEIPLDKFMADIGAAIRKHETEKGDVSAATTGNETPAAAEASRADKTAALKSIILELHAGASLESVRERFNAVAQGVEHAEIAAMEEELIRGGLPAQEIQRLCDLHVGVFKPMLDQQAAPDVPPGHPVHTFMEENKALVRVVGEFDLMIRKLAENRSADAFRAAKPSLLAKLADVAKLDMHYARKENQIFPYLEKHGVTAPPKVMWGVDDEIRTTVKSVRLAVEADDLEAVLARAPKLSRDVVEMVYKENNILFPLTLSTFTEQEWVEIRRGEAEIGYVFVTPAAEWPAQDAAPAAGGAAAQGLFNFDTGALTIEQANLMLKHLPLDLSFVDENDEVRYYSGGEERIFPRSPAVIGRKVQNCHPPKSLDMVNRILDAFRKGERDVAEFWIPFHGRFVHIRYVALRDAKGAYRGTLEITQDVTAIRELQGERKLLDWE